MPTAGRCGTREVAMIEPPNVSLRDRVEALRLPGRVDDPRASSGRGWLPWVLCLLLAGSTVSMALRTPKASQTTESGTGQPAAKAGAPDQQAPAAAEAGARPGAPAVAPGTVALEAKGYIIPAHQLQVSPIEVSGRILKLNFEEGKH